MEELQQNLLELIKQAMKDRAKERLNTLRLMLAKVKDANINARGSEKLTVEQSYALLQTMIKQRQESIKLYQQGNREELALKEQAEIVIIQEFLPQALSDDEMATALDDAIRETGAAGISGMGQVMNYMKTHYAGRLDMGKLAPQVKQKLA